MSKNRKSSRSKTGEGQEKVPPASEVKSETKGGEQRAAETKEKGMRGTGTKGRSGRPSGTRDAEAHTGVDPQNP
ncbi:hypothetical protein [Streptomyces sp. NPDC058773]|uniref:hypothetical protein n=1 Tax=Streptomyces sp. NPDC058773 TaxID=3346632 RepID=UPI0036CF0103